MKSFFGFAVLAGLATVLGLGAPARASASDTITCDAPPLIAANPTLNAQLGGSLSAGGDWLAAGALQDNAKVGSVALYKNPGTPGSTTNPHPRPDQEITASDSHPGDQFGASVSISGLWMAVGAPGKAQNSGAVYLFKFDGTSWVQMASTLSAADAAPGAQFGFSVALNGTTLVVGAPGDSDRGSLAGSAYIFEMTGNSWNQPIELHAVDGRPFDEFGFAVAVAGDQIVVGAPFADDLTFFKNFGAVYVFDNPGVASNGWGQAAKLTAEGGFRGDSIQFGASVAIGAMDAMGMTQIVIGVPGDDLQHRTDSGSAYVFEGSGANWKPLLVIPEDPGAGEQFGSAVLIDGDGGVVIGSRFDGQDGLKAGAAYLFQKNTSWTQINKYIRPAPGAAFGQSVARLGGQVFMGGYLDDVGLVVDAGSVAVCPFVPITKTDNLSTVTAGQTVTYQIDVVAACPGATVTDDIFHTKLESVGWCRGKDCTNFVQEPFADTLPAGGDATYRVRGQVAAGATGHLTNTACVDGGGCPMACATDTDTIQTTPPPLPDLSCVKTGPETAKPGDIVTYDIKVSNSGSAAARNVMLSDPTPAGFSLVSVSGPCTQFPCNLGTIGRDQTLPSVKATFHVDVPLDCAASEQTVNNVASVDGDQCTAQTRIVQPEANLALVLNNLPVAPVTCGTSFSFSVNASNLGPASAMGAVVDITAVGALDLSAPGCDRVLGSPPRLTCNLPNPFAGSVPINFTAQAPACGCGAGCGAVTIDATVRSANTCPEAAMVTQVIPVTCTPVADLAITKTHEPAVLTPGQPMAYTITVSNKGPCDVPSATVIDSLPNEILGPHCVGTNGLDCTFLGNSLNIAVGPLSADGTPVSYRIEGKLTSQCITAPLLNIATVSSPPGIDDPVLSNNTAEDMAPIPPTPGVTIQCSGVSSAFEGDFVTFTYVLSNGGPNAQGTNPGAVFTDTLPAGLTLITATASSGSVMTGVNTVTWNGSIPVCGTVTIAVQAKVDPGTVGMTLCNQGTVAFDANGDGVNESNASAVCCVTIIPVCVGPNCGIPTLGPAGLAALVILLACVGVLRLRRRSL